MTSNEEDSFDEDEFTEFNQDNWDEDAENLISVNSQSSIGRGRPKIQEKWT